MGKDNPLPNIFIKSYSRARNMVLDQRYLPRWAVVLIDLSICMVSGVITYFIIRDTPLHFYKVLDLSQKLSLLIFLHLIFFVVYRTYSGIIRHSTFTDVYRIALATLSMLFVALGANEIFDIIYGSRIFLTTGLLLYSFISLTFLIGFRITVKEAYRFLRDAASGQLKKRVLVLGIEDQIISLTESVLMDPSSEYRPVAFLSSKGKSSKFKILNIPVIYSEKGHNEDFEDLKRRLDLQGILMVGDLLTVPERNQVAESCFKLGLHVYNIPLPEHWQKTSDMQLNIVPLQIEDLLERQAIETDEELITKDLKDKVILVTGGAGSIGSELVRQIARISPKNLVVLDNSESALHSIGLYLKNNFPDVNFRIYLADVTNPGRMDGVFNKYRFDVIYHAAAYKHVPMMERNPREAITTNILGTRNLAELAVKYNAQRFVMVSTDKAVNPSNVMGASKRGAEMFVQALQRKPGVTTRFITTRFGNVLGSSGSVIPFFREQIKKGGPVTVTHKDIIRYFMTIPEACQLVLQAGTMGKGGEIFVFDMGKPVRILDLAERMIKLSGLTPYKDIPIEITGLREGEKLYDELLNDGETTLPTFHPKIMVSNVVEHEYEVINKALNELHILANSTAKKKVIVRCLKELVPEFVSQNSEFSALDVKGDAGKKSK